MPFLLILFLLFFTFNLQAKVINKIVAVVGSEVLTLYELDNLVQPIYQKMVRPEMSEEEKTRIKEYLRKEVLEQWIEDTVIGLEAKKYGIRISEEEFTKFYQVEVGRLGGEEKLKGLLKEEGQTLEEFKRDLRERLLKMKFIQLMVGTKIAIPEEELRKYYQEKVKKHDPSPRYVLEVLVINEESIVPAIFDAILKGKSFSELINRYPGKLLSFKETFKEDELDKNVLLLLKDLQEGEVTKPLQKDKSWQIIRLIKRIVGEPPKFEEIKTQLYDELFQKKAKEYLERWIKELKETKYIKVNL